ncbi:prenyltransferase [Sorangium sp. So ce260]|uniref:prenyltransferase n=1 Tax=Sorangium sp. So ce260 TaxID=3133291 RepID=UPI003F62B77A
MSEGSSGLRLSRLPLYAKFVRVYIVDGPLAMLVGLCAAFREVPLTAAHLAKALICVALGTVLFYIVHALDDITGVKTGTDVKTAPRKAEMGEPKLLASGQISMAEAKALVRWMAAAALGLLCAFGAMTTWPVVAFALAAILITGQYSYGARWSYRGLGEANVVLNFASCVLVPYAFLTGRVTERMMFLGLVCGLFVVVVTFCSNALDYAEDRATGRRSLHVVLGPRLVKVAFIGLLASLWALYAAGLAASMLTPALPALLVVPLHALAARHFLAGRFDIARAHAFRASRLNAFIVCLTLLVGSSAV